MPDEILGFHAQQCAEKLLKAVLAAEGVEFPRTHSIRFLLDLLSDHGLAPPAPLHAVTELYPYAVQSGTTLRSKTTRSIAPRRERFSRACEAGRQSRSRPRLDGDWVIGDVSCIGA